MPLTQLDPKPALVVIDLQKGIVSLPLAHPVEGIIHNAAALANAFRKHVLPVVLVNVAGGTTGRTDAGAHAGSFPPDWTDLIPELEQKPSDLLITKYTIGAFHNTHLDTYLRRMGVTQVVLAGIATSLGVEGTARAAHEYGYNVALVTDAMTDLAAEAHTRSITNVFPLIGETCTTADVISLLGNHPEVSSPSAIEGSSITNLGGGGYHWLQEQRVAGWDDMQRRVAAEREKGFKKLLDYLPSDRRAALHIVDLGAGDGKVAGIVLDHYPNATATLVDFSAPMMAKGSEHLRPFSGRWHYVYWDMNEGSWPSSLKGPFDAIVSSAAVHHLVNARKQWLTGEIGTRLSPGGVFVNYDLFRDPTAVFDDDDVHGRTCATLAEATAFLVNAGYSDITVDARFYVPDQKGEMAVLAGKRPFDAA